MIETVSLKDILKSGDLEHSICSIAIAKKGVKKLTMVISLESNNVKYNIYSGSKLVGQKVSLRDAIEVYNKTILSKYEI